MTEKGLDSYFFQHFFKTFIFNFNINFTAMGSTNLWNRKTTVSLNQVLILNEHESSFDSK